MSYTQKLVSLLIGNIWLRKMSLVGLYGITLKFNFNLYNELLIQNSVQTRSKKIQWTQSIHRYCVSYLITNSVAPDYEYGSFKQEEMVRDSTSFSLVFTINLGTLCSLFTLRCQNLYFCGRYFNNVSYENECGWMYLVLLLPRPLSKADCSSERVIN